MKSPLREYLTKFITDNKREKIEELSELRTRYLTIVLEDIFQPHNASAVIRSCECFGIQNLHVIENKHQYRLNPEVVMGASKWIDLERYNTPHIDNSVLAIEKLKSEGYRIVATTPHTEMELDDLSIDDGKIALFFGTEEHGLSDTVLNAADEKVKIPMYGFTESFNISVSAALCMNFIGTKIRKSDRNWKLSEGEIEDLKLDWTKKCLKQVDAIIEDYEKGK